jgi:PleD family two-component response regulator
MTDVDTLTAAGASADSGRIIVLLVDDQPFVRVVIERLLATEADITLHSCHESSVAIARANQIRPTVILQDLVLPGIDGLTMLKLFRANRATADTPIVVLSASDDQDTRTRALANGATDYVIKLPSKRDLIACIRRHGVRSAPQSFG